MRDESGAVNKQSQIIQGLVSYTKEFLFYSKTKGRERPLKILKQEKLFR